MPKQPANCLRCPWLRQRPGLGKQLRSSCFAKIARNRVPFGMNHFMSDVFVGDGVAHNHRPVVRCKLSPNVGADLGGLANCCAFSQARNAFFAFSPNLPSISAAEKCARSSRTCSLMPAGVGLVSDSVFFEGSAELIAAAFISAPNAEPVMNAKTRPKKTHLGGKSRPGGRRFPSGSLLIRGSLGVRLVRVGLVRFVMADDAPGRSTKFAVSRHVAGDTADDGPLDAALCVRSGRESERNRDRESRRQNPSHVRSPIVKDLQANQSGRTLFRARRAFLR